MHQKVCHVMLVACSRRAEGKAAGGGTCARDHANLGAGGRREALREPPEGFI